MQSNFYTRALSLAALLALSGCASSFGERRYETPSLENAYRIGSAHAGLARCEAEVGSQSLSLHEAVAHRAAMAARDVAPQALEAAYQAGLATRTAYSSPYRVSCSVAQAVLVCSLEDYLKQWRAASAHP